jgi:hypothetical protein
MSVYNTTGISYGCNSTFFVLHPDKCSEIGGTWDANLKWCAAFSLADVKQMELRILDNYNINSICRESPNSARSLFRKPILDKLAVLLVICTVLGMGNAGGIGPRASDVSVISQAQPCIKRVERVGDGNAHPSCRWRQVTDNLQCNGGTCSAGNLASQTLGYTFSGNAGMWSSLGFDVAESATIEGAYSCLGKIGSTVCVTAMVDYTDYTAHEVITGGNCVGAKTQPYIIYSPKKGARVLYKCHHGSNCHGRDWESWKHDGKDCSTYRP